jgi:hypothetical protein
MLSSLWISLQEKNPLFVLFVLSQLGQRIWIQEGENEKNEKTKKVPEWKSLIFSLESKEAFPQAFKSFMETQKEIFCKSIFERMA